MKSWIFVALLASLPQTPSFRIASSELVVLPVVVKDGHGQFIAGLSREQFIVFDNGAPQEVLLFSNEDTPVSIALVIDNSGSMRGKIGGVVAASLDFARRSRPDDELFVVAFSDSVRDALSGRSISADDSRDLDAALQSLVPDGRTAMYDAVLDGLEHLSTAAHARKVLVLISDGGDNASRSNLEQVLARARRDNVTIYTIGLYDDGAPDTDPGTLKRLSTSTGGERFLPQSPGSLIQTCQRIAQEIRSSYTIGYEPSRRDGAFHRIRVQVSHGGRRLDVRTRPGYFAAGPSVRP